MAGNIIDPNDLRLLIKRANQRIVRIEKQYGKDRWAVRDLKSHLDNKMLDAWTSKGRARIPKNATADDVEKIANILEKFTKQKTSSIRTIKERERDIKDSIREKAGRSDIDLDNQDVEALYRALIDDDVKWLQDETRLGSDVWVFLAEGRAKNETKEHFIDRIADYVTNTNEVESRKRLERIYEEYVS